MGLINSRARAKSWFKTRGALDRALLIDPERAILTFYDVKRDGLSFDPVVAGCVEDIVIAHCQNPTDPVETIYANVLKDVDRLSEIALIFPYFSKSTKVVLALCLSDSKPSFEEVQKEYEEHGSYSKSS